MTTTQDNQLKRLQKAYKKIDEAASYSNEDNVGWNPIVPKPGKNKQAEELRDPGSRGTDESQKEFKASGGTPEGSNVTSITREGGASAGNKEVGSDHGKGGEPKGTTVKAVDRSDGSASAPKEYNQDFRLRIQTALGLPLNDKLNQTGKGIEK